MKNRIFFTFIIFGLLFAVVVSKAFYIQVVKVLLEQLLQVIVAAAAAVRQEPLLMVIMLRLEVQEQLRLRVV